MRLELQRDPGERVQEFQFGRMQRLSGRAAFVFDRGRIRPMLAVAGVIINSGRLWFYRASLDRRAIGILLAAALPFLVLGTWIYSVLDARAIGTVLGVTVIASVPGVFVAGRFEVT